MSDDVSNPQVPAPGPKAPSPVISNSDLLAEMDNLGDDLETKVSAKAAPKEKASDGAAKAEVGSDGEEADGGEASGADGEVPGDPEEPDTGDESEESDDDEESEEAPAEDEKPDPLAAKRIADIQKAEKRSKEQIEAYRAQADQQFQDKVRTFEAEWKPKVEAHDKLQKLVDRLDVDLVSYAAERGWDDETALYHAEQLFLKVKGKDDPKLRDKFLAQQKSREHLSKTSSLEKQLAETNAKFERLEQERRDEKFIAKASTVVTDKTPILKAMLAKNPDAAHARIKQAAEIFRRSGAELDPSEIITKLEEAERQDLLVRGIDPDKVYGKPQTKGQEPTPKQKTNEAGERKTAMTPSKNGNNKKPQAPPKPPTRDELIKGLEELERN